MFIPYHLRTQCPTYLPHPTTTCPHCRGRPIKKCALPFEIVEHIRSFADVGGKKGLDQVMGWHPQKMYKKKSVPKGVTQCVVVEKGGERPPWKMVSVFEI